jgi:hypothetical protein
MHVNYRSYDIVNSVEPALLETAIRDDSLPVIDMPYKKIQGTLGEELYEHIDIAFYNTEQFSVTGQHYLKHGTYTEYHPIYDRNKYDAFWDEEERRRKEGITLPCALVVKEDGTYVLQDLHITGEHYGYLNYAPIKRVKQATLIKIDELVRLGEDISELADDKEVSLPQFFDSDYYYFKAIELARAKGKHIVVGKARRKGYSYKNGWLSANRADLYKNTVTGIAAYNSDSLYPEGTMTMADNYLQHISKHTDWSKRRLIDKENTIKFGFKYNDGYGIERGYKSSILARSFATNNPGAIRGKDCTLILLEESGKNPLLSQVLASTLPTLGAGAVKTGLMIVFGTGGGEDKQWEHFESLFYSPSADGFLSFNNIWDEDCRGDECGFFVPSYMGKEGFIDRHGNSNVKGAIAYEEAIRETKKKAKDASKLSDYVMEEPFCPKEAFSRGTSGIFPNADLEEQLRRVQKDEDIKALTRTGNLIRTAQGVKFVDKMFMTPEQEKHYHPPITNFPLRKEDDPHGCFVMWSPPYRSKVDIRKGSLFNVDKDVLIGQVPHNLYRIWCDPFALPKKAEQITGRDSLGVFKVYERTNNFTPGFGDRIVAEFRGRPDTTEKFNEILFAAADYYNAIIMYENDRGDIFDYAREHHRLHQLADEPDVIWQKSLQTSKTGRKKGISINEARRLTGVIYVKDWLVQKRGNDNGKNLLNLHYYYSEAGLKELLRYNLYKGNFDAVSTLIVGQYDIKEQVFTKITDNTNIVSSDSVFNRQLF